MSIEEAKRRADVSSAIFADSLREFTRQWGPTDARELYEFQMSLTRLMVDAMRHQHSELSLGISHYADQVFSDRAMRPLAVIMEKKS